MKTKNILNLTFLHIFWNFMKIEILALKFYRKGWCSSLKWCRSSNDKLHQISFLYKKEGKQEGGTRIPKMLVSKYNICPPIKSQKQTKWFYHLGDSAKLRISISVICACIHWTPKHIMDIEVTWNFKSSSQCIMSNVIKLMLINSSHNI